MKIKGIFISVLVFALLLSGCGLTAPVPDNTPATDAVTESAGTSTDDVSVPAATAPADTSELFSDRDFETQYDESRSTVIRLEGNTASCDSGAVLIDGSTVTITGEGTYLLSGTLDDGMVIVNTDKTEKVQLVLDNASIHSETCAPLYVLQSDKVFLTTAAGSSNTLSCGDSFTPIDENNIDGAIYSKEDLTLNGNGTLVVASPAGHGIVSKDSLTITSGSYEISCASHALAGKDDVCIAGGNFTITSGKDGIHSENADDASSGFVYIASGSYEITAEGDGISAGSYLQIEDGTFQITAGGGSENAEAHSSEGWGNFMGGGGHGGGPGGRPRGGFWSEPSADTTGTATDSTSMKAIKAGGVLTVNGGSFTIDSADDAVHSDTSATISGGSFAIATGDDAFHAEDTLTVTAGNISITESYEGLEGLHILVSGGEITLNASDDGLNAAGGNDSSGFTGGRDGMFGGGPGMGSSSDGSIIISGGTLNVTASGDGIDANGTLEITGGFTTVCGPTQGDTATLDYDVSAVISAGTFIGTGASGMAQTFSDSQQGVIAVNAGNQAAGTQITLTDKNGNTVISYAPALSFNVIILSSPDMVKGEPYTLHVGSLSEDFTAN